MRSGGVPGARGRRPGQTVLRLARDDRDGLSSGPATGQVPVTGPATGQIPVTDPGRGRRGVRLGRVPLDAAVAFVIAVVVVAVVLFVLFGLRR